MPNLPTVLALAVVKGKVTSYAQTVADVENVSLSGLAAILREIADELLRRQ